MNRFVRERAKLQSTQLNDFVLKDILLKILEEKKIFRE